MSVLCPCCDKPLSLVNDIEPFFGLPDEIFAMSHDDRGRRGKIDDDLCTIDWGRSGVTPRCFVRAVMPFAVIGRERPFHWGIWVRVSKQSFVEYVEASADEQDGKTVGDVVQQPDHFWACRIANDMTTPIGSTMPSTLGVSAKLKWCSGNQRPRVHFHPGEQHPLAKLQQSGVDDQLTLEWLKPFHAMMVAD